MEEPAPAQVGRSYRAWIGGLGIFGLALLLRLIYLWQISDSPMYRYVGGDGAAYDAWARRIAGGDWIGGEVFYQAPLYPYFLGIIYAVFGHSLLAVRLVQVALGSAACVLLAGAGRRFFAHRPGWIAGVLLAVWPTAIFSDALIQKSVLDAFFLALLLNVTSRFVGGLRSRPAWWLLAGIAGGGLVLARENALVVVLAMFAWIAWGLRGNPPRVRAAWVGLALLGLMLLLGPVMARNKAVGGELHLTTSQLGSNLYIGNNPDSIGTYVPLRPGRGDAQFERTDATELASAALGRPATPGEVSRYWLGRTLDYIRDRPGHWLWLMARKALLVINAGEIIDTDDQYTYGDYAWLVGLGDDVLHFGVLFPLAMLGIWLTRGRWRELWLLYAILLAYAASVVIFYVVARYRFPLVPVLVLFAAAALAEVPRLIRERRKRELVGSGIVVLIAAVASNWPLVPIDIMRAGGRLTAANLLVAHDLPAAIEQYREAARLHPASPEIHDALGSALSLAGQHEEASRHFVMAIKLRREYDSAWFNAARSYDALDRPKDAIDVYIALINEKRGGDLPRQRLTELLTRRNDADLWFHAGLADFDAGRVAESAHAMERAAELRPAWFGAHFNLGVARRQLGDLDGATAALERALQIQPDSELARNQLELTRRLKASTTRPAEVTR